MKHIKNIFLGLLLWISSNSFAQSYRVGSYNIRLKNEGDTGNLWHERVDALGKLIAFHEWDFFGTQEGFEEQLQDIQDRLPQYQRYGVGRDDGKIAGEHSAIFFLKDKFTVLQSGDFWLSETPDKPSKGWDAKCCNRLVSWVLLKDKISKKSFYIFNAHYDHEGQVARAESSKLILKKIAAIAQTKPAIFMGDLNGGYQTECYQIIEKSALLHDTHQLSPIVYEPNGSFNGFKNPPSGTEIIDHIFVNKDFSVQKWGVLTDTYQGKYPSDHFPIMAVIQF